MLMQPRLQTRSHAGGVVPHRFSEGHSAIARFVRPLAASFLARVPAQRQTVGLLGYKRAASAAVGVSGA
ncbi:MAG: hypothetical protein ABS41_06745 [Arenimonas sp. SCN 70-307]|nr:MAG: hypothetical protein ABS41_06745 [Arenimonas sp. SCN 70-307]